MAVIYRLTWIMGGRLLAALLQATSLIVVARMAGPVEFGVLAAFLGLIVVLQATFDLGIPTYVTRLAAKSRDVPEVVWCLQIFGRFGFLLFVVLTCVAVAVSIHSGEAWWLLCPLAVAGWLERQSDVRLNIAVADGDVWKSSINLVTRRLLTVALLIGFLTLDLDATGAFAVASMLASMVSLWMSRYLVRLLIPTKKIDKTILKEILRASRPFWANSVGAQIRNFDIIVVAAVVSPLVAGYYGAIARSLNPLMMLSTSLASVILPMATKAIGKNGRPLWIPIGGVLGLLFVAYGLMITFMPYGIHQIFGSEFMATVPGFRIAIVGLFFASLSAVQTAFLQARGKERVVGRISVGTSIVMLLAIAGGAVLEGVTGAAVGLAASYAMQCAMLSLTNWRDTRAQRRLAIMGTSVSN